MPYEKNEAELTARFKVHNPPFEHEVPIESLVIYDPHGRPASISGDQTRMDRLWLAETIERLAGDKVVTFEDMGTLRSLADEHYAERWPSRCAGLESVAILIMYGSRIDHIRWR